MTLVHADTLGSPLQSANGRGFTAMDVAYAPELDLPAHAHDRTYVSFVLRGDFLEEAGSARDVARSTTVVIMPAGAHHRNRIGRAGARSLVIGIDDDFEQRLGRISPKRRWVERGAPVQILARAYRAHWLGELGTVEELLYAFADAVRGTPDETRARACVVAARAILHETMLEPWTVSEIAGAVSRDPAYLCRAFRTQVGCTMGEYVRQLRTRRAADLIASSAMPLAEIAAACGFADQSHLTRVFKSQMGMTPNAFRAFASR